MCGDGVPNASAGEECDDGGNSDKCDEDCTTAECGDEFHNPEAGEECDGEPFFMLGGTTKTYLTENSCLECVANVCGDDEQLTAVDTYYCAFYPDVCKPEQCDDGNQDSGDGCSYPACEVE
jgi:cysteine-rich repeat protein